MSARSIFFNLPDLYEKIFLAELFLKSFPYIRTFEIRSFSSCYYDEVISSFNIRRDLPEALPDYSSRSVSFYSIAYLLSGGYSEAVSAEAVSAVIYDNLRGHDASAPHIHSAESSVLTDWYQFFHNI